MNIDWNKLLECEHGAVEVESRTQNTRYVRCNMVKWYVDMDGHPLVDWMPRVYNAKRKPREGETWMFKCTPIGGDNYLKAIYLDKGVGIGRICKPLYPLIKDPSFEE